MSSSAESAGAPAESPGTLASTLPGQSSSSADIAPTQLPDSRLQEAPLPEGPLQEGDLLEELDLPEDLLVDLLGQC